MRAEGRRREKMRLAFIGEGAGCSPEAGLVMPDHDPEAVLEPRGSGRASRGVGADLWAGEGRDISGALRVL